MPRRARRALPGPHLDAGAGAARQVPVAELDAADPPLLPREIDHAGPGVLAEERVDLGVERLAVAELDQHVDHLEVAVEHDHGQLAEPALAARHRDAVVVLAVGIDRALAEHRPAPRLPDRGLAQAVDRDPGAAAAGQVAVPEVDVLDDPLLAREVDRAGALALAEEVLHRGVPRRAALELDRQVDQLEVAVLDHDGELAEPALVAADVDPVVVEPAVDRALAEQGPAPGVERGRRRRRGRGRSGAAGAEAPDLDAGRAAARDVAVADVDEPDHVLRRRQIDHLG